MGTMICFLKEPYVIMLILGLTFWDELFITLCISETLLEERFGKASLILMISLTLLLFDCEFIE